VANILVQAVILSGQATAYKRQASIYPVRLFLSLYLTDKSICSLPLTFGMIIKAFTLTFINAFKLLLKVMFAFEVELIIAEKVRLKVGRLAFFAR
jgi:hypothetical protein